MAYMKTTNRLEEIRTTLGLTYELFGKTVGTSAQQMERLCKGERKITREWIDRISKALNIPGYEIIFDPSDFPSEEDLELLKNYKLIDSSKKEVIDGILFGFARDD